MHQSRDSENKERRRYKRVLASFTMMFKVESPFEVRLQVGDREIDAVAQDISEGGIGVLTDHDIPIGAVLNMKFIVYNDRAVSEADGYRAFQLPGNVRYSFAAKELGYRIGIQFIKISAADINFIKHYVMTNDLKPSSET